MSINYKNKIINFFHSNHMVFENEYLDKFKSAITFTQHNLDLESVAGPSTVLFAVRHNCYVFNKTKSGGFINEHFRKRFSF